MGLFDMFKKKPCCICGNEVGILGNRKLADGNMCSKCTKKLSPWFEDRRESTISQIQEQLEYRARNAEELKNFHPTKTFGDYDYMFVEERNGIPYRFCVSSGEDYLAENADLILFENVEDVTFEIEDNRCEVYDKKGEEEVSFHPPKYDYSFEFRVRLRLKEIPWFDQIEFRLNSECPELSSIEDMGDTEDVIRYAEKPWPIHRKFARIFMRYQQMCNEIEAMVKNPAPSEAAAPAVKVCPSCGAISTGGKFCEYCGSGL